MNLERLRRETDNRVEWRQQFLVRPTLKAMIAEYKIRLKCRAPG